jgi:hypothetical protein
MVPLPLLPASVRDADELARPDDQLRFLTEAVGPTDVVVAARDGDNRVIPALAGRTLALAVPRPFVPDADARAAALDELLDPATAPSRRRQLADRYDVAFVLLRPSDARDRALLPLFLEEGAAVVHEDTTYALLALAGGADG